jgi:spore coat polysaccharide biosynthesis protein SpsF (cytidylyltransferase family)
MKNMNIETACDNFKLEMTQVRCMNQLRDAIVNYFETCFMQMPKNGSFSVHGTEISVNLSHDYEVINIAYENKTPAYMEMRADNVIDIMLDRKEVNSLHRAAKNDEEYYINEVFWNLGEMLGKYFRVKPDVE